MKNLLRFTFVFLLIALALLAGRQRDTLAQTAGVQQITFTSGDAYLLVEFLDDDLVHFETGQGSAPATGSPIATTPMVAKTDYAGPTAFNDDGQGTLTTAELQVVVDAQTLCSTVIDLVREVTVTAVCPQDLDQRKKSLAIDPEAMQAVYGLGEEFRTPGEPNGDWVGSRRTPGIVGNEMQGFSGGAVGNAQFPVLYALGSGMDNVALFVDVVYKQEWDFTGAPWTMTTSADPLRWYVLTGPDLPDLRSDYLELTGRPPVPPKPLFGLWVSEYGYDDWAELDAKRQTLDENQFPQDGFVLDLQWFGGIQTPSQMGSLSWDLDNFPDPAGKIAELQTEEGLELVLIEESYVDKGLSNFGRMASQSYLVKSCETCGPATLPPMWWGSGGMVDWTNEAGAAVWHDANRQPLVDIGVLGHWTDLGEPEMFAPNSWYVGLPGLNLHDQPANHNLYNLLWAQSIAQGYERNGVAQRPSILSRSGISGIQRYGAAMWSADIGSNFDSLAAHMNAQMHMSFSGVDYFGADIGGFHRGNIGGADLDELYTVWFANGALLDVPVRPHTENLCNCKETAPDRIGDVASNLANIRLRYSLSPYLYSLAHRAYLAGEPVTPPLVFYFQADANTRQLGDHKMLGADVLVRTVTEPGVTAVPVYLPPGQWVDFYSGVWLNSSGEWLEDVPVVAFGLFRLPLFLRAGAIVPRMAVDEQTMNLAGLRRDGSVRDELIVQIVPAAEASAFTLYEDDGRTTAYQSGAVRTTELSQQWTGSDITISIAAAEGTFDGAITERNNVLEVALNDEAVEAVLLDGAALPALTNQADFDAAESGWFRGATAVYAKSGRQPIDAAKEFTVQLVGEPAAEVPSTPAPAAEATAVPAEVPPTPAPLETPAPTSSSTSLPGWVAWAANILVVVLVIAASYLLQRGKLTG
ncbi:MAG: DUF5110 domain-containing protein [Chloroflexi bacterium]|nr:DUF5110 domain-containing protein [Chloroflexota bacterium]